MQSAGGIRRFAAIDARCEPRDWDWTDENRAAIRTHWERRLQAQPKLFNGRILMVAEERVVGDRLEVTFFETDYANLLAWLDFGCPDCGVANGFAMGALRASDGAYLLGQMAPHTANVGRVYFPAGTPDRSDVRDDGIVDLTSSIRRELQEETGLPPEAYRLGEGWIVAHHAGITGYMRPITLAEPAEAARRRILAHLSREREPELSEILIVRGPDDVAAIARDKRAIQGYLRLFLDDAFRA